MNAGRERMDATRMEKLRAQPRLQIALQTARCWNWKAALLSVMMRSMALICFVAHGSGGRLRVALDAGLVEAAYVSLTAGVYAALQQRALAVRPRWRGNLLIVVGVPVGAQAMDYLVQRAAGTPHMQVASVGMVGWGLVSALFHLHLMRHGSMLVGDGAGTLRRDLLRMPRLVGLFVAAPVIFLVRKWPRAASRPTQDPGCLHDRKFDADFGMFL